MAVGEGALPSFPDDVTVHIADLSHGTASYSVTGLMARDLLAQGCPLDLHPRAFSASSCARSLLAQVPTTIEHDGAAGFILHADISYADHLNRWFADALIEFERP
jgi:sarcosine oxidase subunit gamma